MDINWVNLCPLIPTSCNWAGGYTTGSRFLFAKAGVGVTAVLSHRLRSDKPAVPCRAIVGADLRLPLHPHSLDSHTPDNRTSVDWGGCCDGRSDSNGIPVNCRRD